MQCIIYKQCVSFKCRFMIICQVLGSFVKIVPFLISICSQKLSKMPNFLRKIAPIVFFIEPVSDACEIHNSLHLSFKMQFGNTLARWRLSTNENQKTDTSVEYANVREAYKIIKEFGKRNPGKSVDNITMNW